ncbi:hypothetical protein HU200_030545 [Digitaria exilis]|uniref:Uncharacterized protein n=1 Tax=Digitaria exilis TaxID=1010633 RepID=A0A835BWY2_9POAL|nr:hypothetical protein HU200_030545 [Digitaria exilis]
MSRLDCLSCIKRGNGCASKRFFFNSMTPAFPDPRSSMMAGRIHPSSETTTPRRPSSSSAALRYYTVWKRSSMGFQGTDGFSVYDAGGALVFRVDNYSRRRKIFAGELLLMDGQGSPLLALRPQVLYYGDPSISLLVYFVNVFTSTSRAKLKLKRSYNFFKQIFSMHDQWNCYTASEQVQGKRTKSHQVFSMRKCSVLLKGHEAEVSVSGCGTASDHTGQGSSFWIEGCFRRRSCKIRSSDGKKVAMIMRKKAEAASSSLTLGDDMFSLVVEPNVDCTMIMASIVVLDRICWRPYTPMICSS